MTTEEAIKELESIAVRVDNISVVTASVSLRVINGEAKKVYSVQANMRTQIFFEYGCGNSFEEAIQNLKDNYEKSKTKRRL